MLKIIFSVILFSQLFSSIKSKIWFFVGDIIDNARIFCLISLSFLRYEFNWEEGGNFFVLVPKVNQSSLRFNIILIIFVFYFVHQSIE